VCVAFASDWPAFTNTLKKIIGGEEEEVQRKRIKGERERLLWQLSH
jgi:hypothetical protein